MCDYEIYASIVISLVEFDMLLMSQSMTFDYIIWEFVTQRW